MHGGRSLEVGSESRAGVRIDNQDRIDHFDTPFGHVFLVADGVGGHRNGGQAAEIVRSGMPDVMRSLSPALAPRAALLETTQQLNAMVFEANREAEMPTEAMGSTLAALLVTDSGDGLLAAGIHVGDSRIYFCRGDRLFLLTCDHTVVQRLVESRQLGTDAARVHPSAGVLTQAIGQSPDVSPDLTPWFRLETGDRLLVCSDGVSSHASNETIRDILASGESAAASARTLVDVALQAGSSDNLSALVVHVGSSRSATARM